ncbi:methyltransferase domain-containing protein [Bradyrhizobium diazoefficiens]|uniref:methyltransferase domain-containing protein n=1 Tax=Bradyrhizobium diazoefficiens TaxID=1355477 RepID=UPI00272A711E|nr:methyltransferase domain-containing protein [Bradyrhizobium diazoefficiens]WLA74091.1 methyltransferase domain-containing protein [Bradyrhizobium diazoefficiens]
MTLPTNADTVLAKLQSDVQSGRIAIFLGAGISAALAENPRIDGFNVASWGGLLTHGAKWLLDWCRYEDDFFKSIELDIRGDTTTMLAAAQKVSQGLKDHNEYEKWLRASVGTLKYSSRAAVLAEYLKAFAAKQIPLITTNYDGLLEAAMGLEAITWQDKERLLQQLDRSTARSPKIIHLHGQYERPESVVLGITDYTTLLGDEFLEAWRTSLGLTNSLLFIGFGKGLDDPHFLKFISLVQKLIRHGDNRIYRLCRTEECDELTKQNMGIPVAYGDDFAQLPEFLGKFLQGGLPESKKPPFMPKCVLLVGRYTAEQQKRAIEVVDKHLKPACLAANYFVPEIDDDEDLYDASMSHLLHAPMAIAYVGKRTWPSDILAKVGFRLATGKPLVLVFERGEEFRPGQFDSLYTLMLLRKMQPISVAPSDATNASLRATVNEQITRELQTQSANFFGARPIHPMAVVRIDTNRDEDEYIDATESTLGLLTEDKYLLGRRGTDIVKSLEPRIEPEQWPYFSREQDRLYKLFLEQPGSLELGSVTPIARIPLVYKQPVNGATKAILPIVTRHASKAGIHHMEVLHLDVTASMMRMADGHYELVSPRGIDEVACAALAEDRWFYSPSPSLEIKDGLIVDTNLICRVLLDATDGSLHGKPVKSLLAKLPLDEDDLGFGEPQFDLDSITARLNPLEIASETFGKIDVRAFSRPMINLISGRPVGMSWDWAIKEVEREAEFLKTFREQLTRSLKWDVYSTNYDRVLPLCEYYSNAVARHVSYLTPPEAEDIVKVCDIGAGTGNLSLQLLEKGCHVTAVDLSRSMLRQLKAKTTIGYSSRLRILQQSAERLPQLDNSSFDAVTVMMALYGMKKPTEALDECIRILKDGGKLVITEPTAQLDVEKIIKGAEASLKEKGLLEALAEPWQRVQEAGRWLRETIGFRIEDIEAVLAKERFVIQTKASSHFDQCATIVAIKPR